MLAQHNPRRPRGRVSVKAFDMPVARLGGHHNRTGDGFPGWLTLWRGWMKLEALSSDTALLNANNEKDAVKLKP